MKSLVFRGAAVVNEKLLSERRFGGKAFELINLIEERKKMENHDYCSGAFEGSWGGFSVFVTCG